MGPNMKRLICEKTAQQMVPSGQGLQGTIDAILKPGRLATEAKQASEWCRLAIKAVLSAPDCLYTTEEEIAGEILRQLNLKKSNRR